MAHLATPFQTVPGRLFGALLDPRWNDIQWTWTHWPYSWQTISLVATRFVDWATFRAQTLPSVCQQAFGSFGHSHLHPTPHPPAPLHPTHMACPSGGRHLTLTTPHFATEGRPAHECRTGHSRDDFHPRQDSLHLHQGRFPHLEGWTDMAGGTQACLLPPHSHLASLALLPNTYWMGSLSLPASTTCLWHAELHLHSHTPRPP